MDVLGMTMMEVAAMTIAIRKNVFDRLGFNWALAEACMAPYVLGAICQFWYFPLCDRQGCHALHRRQVGGH
jgi:hypothetical protein